VCICARVCAKQLIMNAFGSEKSANRSAGKWTPVVGDVSRWHPRTSCGVPSAVNPHHMALIAIVSRVVIAAAAAASEVETSVSRAHKQHWFGRCTASVVYNNNNNNNILLKLSTINKVFSSLIVCCQFVFLLSSI